MSSKTAQNGEEVRQVEEKEVKKIVQRETKWQRRFYTTLILVVTISNLYFVIDTIKTNQTRRALNQQMQETDMRWANVIDRIQSRLDSLK